MNANVLVEAGKPLLARDGGDATAHSDPAPDPCVAKTSAASAPRFANIDLFRLASLLLVLPNAIFAASLRPAPAIAILIACSVSLATLMRNPAPANGVLLARVDLRLLSFCLGLAIALSLLGGAGHFFYAPPDWLWRDAVLADVVRTGPAALYDYGGHAYLLRAPLGMYLTPGAIGALFGLYAAHMSLLAQNALILAIVLYFVTLLSQAKPFVFALLFVVFSGADLLPTIVTELAHFAKTGTFIEFVDIEWWTDYWTSTPLQFSSHITQWFWVPNHMIPGWWMALLALLYVRREVDLATLGVSFAALLLWSPLAMIGIAPFLLMFGIEGRSLKIVTPRLLAAAAGAACFGPLLFYLSIDAGAVPHQLLFGTSGFLLLYVAFIFVEIPQMGVVAYAWRLLARCDVRLLALSAILLLIIPFYKIGESNDFAMRASIPALFLLAFAFSRIAALTPRDNGAFATIIGVIVLAGFATPMLALKQSFGTSYALSDCNFVTAANKTSAKKLPTNYLARIEAAPHWLIVPSGTPVKPEARQCWPDHPLLDEKMK